MEHLKALHERAIEALALRIGGVAIGIEGSLKDSKTKRERGISLMIKTQLE